MELFKILGTIAINNSDANKSLKETSSAASGAAKGFENAASSGESSSNKITSAFKKIGSIVVASFAVDKIKDFGTACLQAAADAQASASQFSQVFGDLENQAANSLSSIAKESGIVETRMKGSFTKIAAFAKTTGMNTEDALALSERALVAVADSAAFYDRSLEETTASLQSFLKGNFENDAALGLSCTETTRNAAANKLYGKSFKDLSESQKQLTLLQMVEDANKLSGALGQASRESDTWSNQTGNMAQAWQNFRSAIGGIFLDVAVASIKKSVSGIEKMTAAVQKIAPIIKSVADKAWSAWGNFTDKLAGAWDSKVKPALQAFWSFATETLAPAIQTVFDTIIRPYIINTFNRIKETWENVLQPALQMLTGFLKGEFSRVFAEIFSRASQAMQSFRDIGADLRERFLQYMPAILEAAQKALGAIVNLWDNHLKPCFDAFLSLVVNELAPQISAAFEHIMPVVEWLFNSIVNIWDTFLYPTLLDIIDFFTSIFSSDVSAAFDLVFAAFDAIVYVVTSVYDAVAEYFPMIQGIISDVFAIAAQIWNDVLLPAFSAIKNYIEQKLMPAFELVFNGFIKPIIQNVFNTIGSLWNNSLKPIFEGIISFLNGVFTGNWSKIWEGIKSILSGVWGAIKTIVSSALDSVKNTVSSILSAVANYFSNKWAEIVSKTKEKFAAVRSAIEEPIEKAKAKIKEILDNIKSFFANTKLELPKIKLPHFSISGKFSLDPPSIPHISVDWYKKAMNAPMLLNEPTIFGYDANSGNLMGGGEAGQEVVAGSNTLMNMIRASVSEQNSVVVYYLKNLIEVLATYFPQVLAAMDRELVLDSGELVGALASPMDEALGRIKSRKDRGR